MRELNTWLTVGASPPSFRPPAAVRLKAPGGWSSIDHNLSLCDEAEYTRSCSRFRMRGLSGNQRDSVPTALDTVEIEPFEFLPGAGVEFTTVVYSTWKYGNRPDGFGPCWEGECRPGSKGARAGASATLSLNAAARIFTLRFTCWGITIYVRFRPESKRYVFIRKWNGNVLLRPDFFPWDTFEAARSSTLNLKKLIVQDFSAPSVHETILTKQTGETYISMNGTQVRLTALCDSPYDTPRTFLVTRAGEDFVIDQIDFSLGDDGHEILILRKFHNVDDDNMSIIERLEASQSAVLQGSQTECDLVSTPSLGEPVGLRGSPAESPYCSSTPDSELVELPRVVYY